MVQFLGVGHEMTVSFLRATRIRVACYPRIFKWCHEHTPLSHAPRPFALRQVRKRLASDAFLGHVITFLHNSLEPKTRSIQAWVEHTRPSQPESCHGTRIDICIFGYIIIPSPRNYSISPRINFKS